MSEKILIFGATGAVGSALANLIKDDSKEAHLISKSEEEVSKIADQTGFTYSVADVLESNFIEKIKQDLNDTDVSGIVYCVGSIDFKPINLITRKDILSLESNHGEKWPRWLVRDSAYRVGRGSYSLPTLGQVVEAESAEGE